MEGIPSRLAALSIKGNIWPFRHYLDYIGPKLVSPTGPGNNQGYPWIQPYTYKVHYIGLYVYGQPKLYHYLQ